MDFPAFSTRYCSRLSCYVTGWFPLILFRCFCRFHPVIFPSCMALVILLRLVFHSLIRVHCLLGQVASIARTSDNLFDAFGNVFVYAH